MGSKKYKCLDGAIMVNNVSLVPLWYLCPVVDLLLHVHFPTDMLLLIDWSVRRPSLCLFTYWLVSSASLLQCRSLPIFGGRFIPFSLFSSWPSVFPCLTNIYGDANIPISGHTYSYIRICISTDNPQPHNYTNTHRTKPVYYVPLQFLKSKPKQLEGLLRINTITMWEREISDIQCKFSKMTHD